MTLSVSVEFHHFHGALAAAIKVFAVTHFASFAEPAFFHYASRGGVVDEKVAPKATVKETPKEKAAEKKTDAKAPNKTPAKQGKK